MTWLTALLIGVLATFVAAALIWLGKEWIRWRQTLSATGWLFVWLGHQSDFADLPNIDDDALLHADTVVAVNKIMNAVDAYRASHRRFMKTNGTIGKFGDEIRVRIRRTIQSVK